MKDLALPELLKEIADAAGIDAALTIARAKGGVRVRFSAHPKSDNWLVPIVGMDLAQTIGKALCGGLPNVFLEVPLGPSRSNAQRWRRMLELYDQGKSQDQIARLLGVHYKTVQRVLNGKRKTIDGAIAQQDFFEL